MQETVLILYNCDGFGKEGVVGQFLKTQTVGFYFYNIGESFIGQPFHSPPLLKTYLHKAFMTKETLVEGLVQPLDGLYC